eukprot:TRINITY_DN14470_c0_g1_i2.p1 TRINITY_DN14470_c0_g1~~TRINITY_DN14470_c0_g1_i2.p1  ORF type:complete len:114 (+),score=24.89 TRINITY_DN14470_c0_g1_i2:158-499(+)
MQRGLVGSEMCIRDSFISPFFSTYSLVTFCFCSLFSSAVQIFFITFEPFLSFWNFQVLFLTCFHRFPFTTIPVSYTHLTLPTILLVQISVVAVSLKKKKDKKEKQRSHIIPRE